MHKLGKSFTQQLPAGENDQYPPNGQIFGISASLQALFRFLHPVLILPSIKFLWQYYHESSTFEHLFRSFCRTRLAQTFAGSVSGGHHIGHGGGILKSIHCSLPWLGDVRFQRGKRNGTSEPHNRVERKLKFPPQLPFVGLSHVKPIVNGCKSRVREEKCK